MFGSIIGRGLGGGSTTGRFSSTPLSKGASLRFGNRSDRKASPGGSGVAVRQQGRILLSDRSAWRGVRHRSDPGRISLLPRCIVRLTQFWHDIRCRTLEIGFCLSANIVFGPGRTVGRGCTTESCISHDESQEKVKKGYRRRLPRLLVSEEVNCVSRAQAELLHRIASTHHPAQVEAQ